MQYSTSVFEKLKEEKKNRIIEMAIKEFSEKGYDGANTNNIAALSGIAVGSLFKYFRSKHDLFLYIVEVGANELETKIGMVLHQNRGFFKTVESLLNLILEYSRQDRAFVRLYHELTSIGQSNLAREIVTHLESYAVSRYTGLIEKAMETGEVRGDINSAVAAFTLDNIFMALQFAYALPYYKERRDLYLKSQISDHDLIENTMVLVHNTFDPPRE